MMTNGPSATIGEVLDVKLARPRDRLALADNPEYNHYRHEVLTFLYEKQKKVETVSSRQSAKKSSDSKKSNAA
ncbi:ABC transporter ATP-binding protein, partial [Alteromonas sp. AMM-1]